MQSTDNSGKESQEMVLEEAGRSDLMHRRPDVHGIALKMTLEIGRSGADDGAGGIAYANPVAHRIGMLFPEAVPHDCRAALVARRAGQEILVFPKEASCGGSEPEKCEIVAGDEGARHVGGR